MKSGILAINGHPVERVRLNAYLFSEDARTTTYQQYMETLPDGRRNLVLEFGDDQPLDNTIEFTVPPGTFFMMGDNRDDSADSRDSTSGVGFVPRDRLIGKAAFIYFSIAGQSAARNASLPSRVRWNRIGLPLS